MKLLVLNSFLALNTYPDRIVVILVPKTLDQNKLHSNLS